MRTISDLGRPLELSIATAMISRLPTLQGSCSLLLVRDLGVARFINLVPLVPRVLSRRIRSQAAERWRIQQGIFFGKKLKSPPQDSATTVPTRSRQG
jgi:hypothetical protein